MEERRLDKDTLSSGSTWPVDHLSNAQIHQLTEAFRLWHQMASSTFTRRVRGRYWLTYLFLRFSGARIGEILRLDDSADIDYGRNEIRIPSTEEGSSKAVLRTIPVPSEIISQLLAYISEFPGMQSRVFSLDQGNFRREFYRRAEEANLPRPVSHPHILRHTRAVELLTAGVPFTIVQDILGHVLRSSTALYIERPEITAGRVLREKGLL